MCHICHCVSPSTPLHFSSCTVTFHPPLPPFWITSYVAGPWQLWLLGFERPPTRLFTWFSPFWITHHAGRHGSLAWSLLLPVCLHGLSSPLSPFCPQTTAHLLRGLFSPPSLLKITTTTFYAVTSYDSQRLQLHPSVGFLTRHPLNSVRTALLSCLFTAPPPELSTSLDDQERLDKPHAAHQASLSTGLRKQACWKELPSPPLGELPDPGIEASSLVSPALAGRFFTPCAPWEAHFETNFRINVASYISSNYPL